MSYSFKQFRDGLQQGIYAVINPFVRFLIRIGVTPNVVTTIGLLGNLAAATLFAIAGYTATEADPRWELVAIGGAVIIIFSMFDMLDGQVARIGGMTSTFGAFYDSVLDRYCELLTLGGIAYYMICTGWPIGALITFLALVGSIMVSYTRARAEGLSVECKVGFMQRPERVVVTALSSIVAGAVGASGAPDTAMYILVAAMGLIAVLANVTAFARIAHVKNNLKNSYPPPQSNRL